MWVHQSAATRVCRELAQTHDHEWSLGGTQRVQCIAVVSVPSLRTNGKPDIISPDREGEGGQTSSPTETKQGPNSTSSNPAWDDHLRGACVDVTHCELVCAFLPLMLASLALLQPAQPAQPSAGVEPAL